MEIFEKWWANNTKCFGIRNYRSEWKKIGNRPRISFNTNNAKKKNGDICLDISIIIGYTIFNYTNFNLQGDNYV